jgi:DegV family protein with EDD domain
MTIRIVTDSTCDLPTAVAEQLQIIVVPAYVNIGDKSYLDGVDLTREQFYRELEGYPTPPTTAAPSSGAFSEIYKNLADEGATDIISIHVASKLSGILNAARLGAEDAEGARVSLFDSQSLSMGLGLLAQMAAEAAANGRSLDDIMALLDSAARRTYVFALLDTLEFLRRSGRVNWAQFGIGSLLKVKPLVRVYGGVLEMQEKIRTSKKATEKMIERIGELGQYERVALLHTAAPDEVEVLRGQLSHIIPAGDNPPAVFVTPAVGAHVGPRALGFAGILRP